MSLNRPPLVAFRVQHTRVLVYRLKAKYITIASILSLLWPNIL
jgi:hypothetical protein